MDNKRILVAEDEDIAREYLCHMLRDKGYEVFEAATGQAALEALDEREYFLVLSDIRMPGVDGMRLLEHIKGTSPDTEVILVTGYASVEDAVAAMKAGAYQYVAKPLRLEQIALMVERALEKRAIKVELNELKQHLHNANVPRIIGHSQGIRELKKQIRQIAPADCTVLILGETGTGKELVARSLHAGSPRSGKRFLAVNCATFTEELLAHELFGHEKAAFTGAYNTRKGLLEAAENGTFFLDEVGDMSLGMQASMLRVLENRTVFRVGGTREIPVDVRIIAATNRDLHKMVEEGTFRMDLLYRLNTMTLRMPPLCERREDIPLLARFFLSRCGAGMGKKIGGIDRKARDMLAAYAFPGNVRELEHIMERAAILCNGDTITAAHLPPEVKNGTESAPAPCPGREKGRPFVSLEENEKRYLTEVLEETGWSTSKAALLLGMNRGSLWRKLKRFGLTDRADEQGKDG